jgi:hypothetical protein
VVLNALIGFAQEYRAGKAIEALAQLVSEPARARRDGRWTQAGAEAGAGCRAASPMSSAGAGRLHDDRIPQHGRSLR